MEVSDYIRRIAQRTGYKREFFLEKNMPTHHSNVVAIPFYGDLRSVSILSSLILRSYCEINKEKYFILCSWPGMRGLFPYVHEYWSLDDESVIRSLASGAINLYNDSNLAIDLTRSLAEVVNVNTGNEFKEFYNNKLTKKYFDAFKNINRFLPEVPSASLLSSDFRTKMDRCRGQKLIVYPVTRMRSRQQGKTVNLPVSKDFWVNLIERLILEGYSPIVYQNHFTYDMSTDFADKCIYLVSKNISDIIAAMRYIGCVLDIHSDISRIALIARCPFVSVTERHIYIEDHDYEIDDLCSDGLPKQYIYGFSTHLMAGDQNDWKLSIVDNIIVRLREFIPTLKLAKLPSTNESFVEVSHEIVRNRKAKRMGVTFINSSKKK